MSKDRRGSRKTDGRRDHDRDDPQSYGRMDFKEFKGFAKRDLMAARLLAVAKSVALAQIQLWELRL